MLIKTATFVASNTDYTKCPRPNMPEYALIGRSNVGKSSLTNMLTNNRSLAKTSVKPGKTQVINHFLIDDRWYLVDLPGYGWAKVSKEKKADFSKMTADYLLHRENLQCVFVLIDSRLEPQQIDLDFIDWTGSNGIPLALIFTKADKQSPNQTQRNISIFKKELLKTWEELPPYFTTSSETGLGKDEVLNFMLEAGKSFKRF